ncbi:TetR/AcrR family transcriptional regulator [Luteolibacter marinus]|uniref:TetR/AcrR family transcriptional regulator n=1 Tax=Luteolibacter marinus TaxID=2776705 RepID=UPI001868C478|nr:TetR/AcrR family transcriptional regulator [Luteolibacter marinus]
MSGDTTHDRLLNAAIGIFAGKGYRDATVAEVCDAAGANIASVNYHFGSKESLFRLVLREAFQRANEIYPIHGNLAPDAAPELRLHAFMAALIRRGFDEGPAGDFNRIMIHQGTRESAPDELIHSEIARLEGDTLESILSSLLGTRARELLLLAKMDVIGLCVFPGVARRVRSYLFPEAPQPARLKQYIDRQHAFALAGLSTLAPASA